VQKNEVNVDVSQGMSNHCAVCGWPHIMQALGWCEFLV